MWEGPFVNRALRHEPKGEKDCASFESKICRCCPGCERVRSVFPLLCARDYFEAKLAWRGAVEINFTSSTIFRVKRKTR